MTDIRFACPECSQSLEAPSDMAGNEIDCPTCKKRISIPAVRPVPPPTSPPKVRSPVVVIGAVAAALAAMLIVSIVVLAVVIGGQRSSTKNAGDSSSSHGLFRESRKEKQKASTLRAWRDLQAIDNQLGQTQFATLSARLRQQAYSYSTIDLSDVDTILQKHLQECVSTCQEAAELCAEIETKVAAIHQNTEAAAGLGALLGAAGSDGYNPQGDAAAGALLFGLIGAAAQQQESENIQYQYGSQWQRMEQRIYGLNDADKRVAAQLTEKYGVPFTDPF